MEPVVLMTALAVVAAAFKMAEAAVAEVALAVEAVS